jgi:hypothetical protein
MYKSLIRAMPPVNQYLLLYVLDLLSVFARKSDVNLMTAPSMSFLNKKGKGADDRSRTYLPTWSTVAP